MVMCFQCWCDVERDKVKEIRESQNKRIKVCENCYKEICKCQKKGM